MKESLDVKAFKIVSTLLIILVCGSLVLFFYAEFTGTDLVLPWKTDVTYFPKPLFLEYFKIEGQSVGFYVDQYANWQNYTVGNMRYIEWPTYLILATVLLFLLLICTAVTYFKRFWYLITLGVMIILTLQFKIDQLLLWGDYGNYLALAILILSTYFFHAIKPEVSLSTRLSVIGLLLVLFVIIAGAFSETEAIGLTAISYGLQLPVILALLFIVFVAGQNIYSILKVTTAKGGSGKNNLFHFIMFGVIYNAVLILLFLNKRGEIDFELTLINPYIILIISTISAYYSFDIRLAKQKGIMPLTLLKKWIFPIMFVCTLTLIAFAKLSANDPLVESLEYGIILIHLALGSTYFIASFVNFTPLILKNLSVHKVYFKPTVAPNFLIALVAFAATVSLIFYVNFYPYYQMQAGLYNVLGDLSEHKENDLLAEQYYKQGVAFDFVNFKSNFQAAKYDRVNRNPVGFIQSMQNTFFKNSSGKGHVALSNYYNSQNQQFNTLFELKEAKNKLISKEVNNNLAFTYRQLTVYDSAYLLLKANYKLNNDQLASSNLLALGTELPNIVNSDSLINLMPINDLRFRSNAAALANINGTKIKFNLALAQDTFLLQDDLFYLVNSSLNLKNETDSTKIDAIDYYLSNPYNGKLKNQLLKAKALQLYALGQVNSAFQILELLIVTDNQESANYNFMLGVWALQQKQKRLSNDFLRTASEQGYDKKQIELIQKIILNDDMLIYSRPVKTNLEKLKANANIEYLTLMASANAFDESTTLEAIEALRMLKADNQVLYEIFVETHSINKYSIPIFQGYILSAIDAGLSKYALEGLLELSELMPTSAFDNFDRIVKQRIEQKRNQLF